mmetsp:Transcript_25038/g.34504  ORF Transcript_25038/g.34504 Transcript_25038/m.34504 type:complete len:230 (-) Transcript_25038:201-890(-)
MTLRSPSSQHESKTMVNLAILISNMRNNAHCFGFNSSPALHIVWGAMSSTTPWLSLVGIPEARIFGSRVCAMPAPKGPTTGPSGSSSVEMAFCPGRAKSSSSCNANISSTSSWPSEVNSSPAKPFSRSLTPSNPWRNAVDASLPSATCITLLDPKKNLLVAVISSLSFLSALFLKFLNLKTYNLGYCSTHPRMDSTSVVFPSRPLLFVFVRLTTLLRLDLGILNSYKGL